MKSTFRHAIVLIGCLFLYACGSKKGLQVISRNFDSEIEQQQNLVFGFNKDVFPDSLLNIWDSTAYITFSPAVKGQFRWSSSSEITFSPATGFEPGTAYTAHLTPQLLRRSKVQYGVSDEPIKFHTAPLRVVAAQLSWVRGKGNGNVMVQLDLALNYEVNLAEAASRLKLASGGNAVAVGSAGSGTGKVLSVQFMPLNDRDEETQLNVSLARGITVKGSQYTSAQDTAFATYIPSRYTLKVTSITAQHTGAEGAITVSMSQPVAVANLKECIAIQPVVPFDVVADDAGFTISSTSLTASQTYVLTLTTRMEGAFGGKMKSEHSEQITFGKLKPSVTFKNTKGMYLSGSGYKNVALDIVNTSAVEVSITKVYENNLEQFMRRGTNYGYHYDEGDDGGEYEYYETEQMGDEIFKQTYETKKLPRSNGAYLLKLDFTDKIKEHNGIYVIRVSSKEHNWVQQSKILCISDIGLIVREEQDGMYVFANSIKKATGLAGVQVSFISTNNQKLYTANTDAEGVAVFKNISTAAPGFKVGLVTARQGQDYSMVLMDKTLIATSRFDVGGRSPNASGLNAMIYAERNLYRPGETIHLSTIIRDEQWNKPGEVPVKIKLVMPNGKEFAMVRKILNEQGSCDVSFSPPATAMTGTYTANVYTGNDVLLNAYEISVEEFVPDRIKSMLKADKDEYAPGDDIKAMLQADNLFGTPAAGRNYEYELNMSKTSFSADKFPGYTFEIRNEFQFSPDHRTGKTDANGGATEIFKLPPTLADAGMLKGNIMATVFDETGRPVHRYANFTVYTQPVFAGIRDGETYVTSRKPVPVGLVVLDKRGLPQTASVQVVVLRKEWHTVIQQNGSSYRYVSQNEDRVLSRREVQVSGSATTYMFTPQESGDYEVRVYPKGSENYVSRRFYAYGWGDTQYSSFEVDNEGNVDITPDKKEYASGEDVNVLFTTPFEGRMLVTLERDKVIKYYYLNTNNKSASLKFKAEEPMLPNVYITATLFRPMVGDDMPLTVAHGFKPVMISDRNNKLPVSVQVTDKSRSRTKQRIQVKTAPHAFVTIAAVDEGILQVKNFATPDPYEWFYRKVALGVRSFDIYPWLMPEIKTSLSSTGGDGADKSAMRLNPMFVNRIKNVSYWSGILQADGSGNVRYDVEIPQFSGDIRVMAVAYKDKAFGSADQHMKVADPVVVSVALPRFLSPKDEVVMPVTMSNTTVKDATATVTVQVTGPLTISSSATQTVQLPASREGRAVFNITALPAIGACKVTVTVKAMGETFVNETEIGVRPPASLQKVTGSGFAAQQVTTPIDVTNNFIPSSAAGKLIVGKSPLTEFSKNLDDLVRYPYGCVEQTTSAAFPQLYYADLAKSIGSNSDLNPAYNVQQAINKLQSMQQGDGGLSYWPGGGEESWWGSIYAGHFLLEARKSGYEVNAGTVDRLLQYMKYKLNRKEVMTYTYNNGKDKKEVAPREAAYSLYVLAMAGQAQQATMNYYKAHRELLTLDSKYLLAAAYSLSGQPSQSRDVLPAAFSGEVSPRAFGGSFYSYIRDLAISLNVLMDTDPGNKQVGIMARQLSEQLRQERYLSTQENVFGILALGKIARIANATTATATITAGGKTIGTTAGSALALSLKPYLTTPVAVQVKGNGGYYYFWEVSGISADGTYKQEDSYLKVRRTFFNREGREITDNTFRQNDLVVVRISIEAQYDGNIENVAITDMLPAGLEIENTRLSEMPALQWIKQEAQADYVDIRDDRINMFATVSRRRKDFYYMVRAVSPGTYQLGPVQADAMYDGNYHSYHGAGVVKVTEQ